MEYSQTTSESNNIGTNNNVGIIAGSLVGTVVAIVIISIIAGLLYKRHKGKF
jgi:hypothetical protein